MTDTFLELTTKYEIESKSLNYKYLVVIKRRESGAFQYGDHSCCIVELFDLNNNKSIREDCYDTRYDRISTEREKWLKFWKSFILNNWLEVETIKLISHETQTVKARD